MDSIVQIWGRFIYRDEFIIGIIYKRLKKEKI